jgi:excisionase family DNA binding protein
VSEIIDSEQCAELLHCTAEQVEELARAGDIPALKIGRSWIFIKDDLLRYLAEWARKEAANRMARRKKRPPS